MRMKDMEQKEKMKKLAKNMLVSAVILMIIFMIPILIGGYIQYKRSDWETDRNFYGKNIILKDIVIKNKNAKKVVYSTNKFEKYKVNGKVVYFLHSKGRKIQISSNDYKKYVENSDKVMMYAKRCVCTYMSKKGKIKATVISNKFSFSQEKFTKEELDSIKKTLWRKCQDKIFVYKNTKNIISDDHTDDKIGLKDWRGQKVCTSFSFQDSQTNIIGNVKGTSLIKPGRYDRLYLDSDMYVRNYPKYGLKDKILNLSAELFYGGQSEIFYIILSLIIYIAMSLLLAISIPVLVGFFIIVIGGWDLTELLCNHDCRNCCFYCSFYNQCSLKQRPNCQCCFFYNYCENTKKTKLKVR